MILFHKYCVMPMVYQCFCPIVTTPRPTQVYQQEMRLEAQRTTRFTGGKG